MELITVGCQCNSTGILQIILCGYPDTTEIVLVHSMTPKNKSYKIPTCSLLLNGGVPFIYINDLKDYIFNNLIISNILDYYLLSYFFSFYLKNGKTIIFLLMLPHSY